LRLFLIIALERRERDPEKPHGLGKRHLVLQQCDCQAFEVAAAGDRSGDRPRNPAVAASAISAAIASGVVGISDHFVVDRTDEGGMAFHAQADPPMVDLAGVTLKGGGKQCVRGVAGEREEQVLHALSRNAMFEQRVARDW
jgi:hypothetical protein